MKLYETAQDVFSAEFLEDDKQQSNETLDLLRFMQLNSVPFSQDQFRAILMLQEYGLEDIAEKAVKMKHLATPFDVYTKTIDKLTLADRIRGNAKLSHLMKTEGNANPAGTLKASDVQAQGMSRREIDRY